MDLKKIKLPSWASFINNCFTTAISIEYSNGDYTFPPSDEFVNELNSNFTSAGVKRFENGPTFSAYHVSYDIGGQHGAAIYKSDAASYPHFDMYDTVEEYEKSFSLDD